MRIIIDTEAGTLHCEEAGRTQQLPLYSPAAFAILARQWVRVGWDQKYSYQFTWMGRPIIQLPEDIVRIQELIYRVQPDVLIETGVAHGGSLILYASLFKAMGRGRVIGVDVEIRPHNRAAIEAHPLAPFITLIEGDSVAPATVAKVRSLVRPGERVLVILDSCHTYQHVLAELEAYAGLVTSGSYLVATDGIMFDLTDVPRGEPSWAQDNPASAARQFAAVHPEFVLERPPIAFSESPITCEVTYWPGAYLRRR